jgi:predicted TIM-barrel fold metal-dependent hydrolase
LTPYPCAQQPHELPLGLEMPSQHAIIRREIHGPFSCCYAAANCHDEMRGYFQLAGSNPTLLESVLDDVRLRKTMFVLIHGGAGPFTREMSYLLMKPNVYTDLSEQTWLVFPHRLAEVVRNWLEWYPEK